MKNYKEKALIFKAFCDENRLKILDSIGSGECCACNLLSELNISQPTLSHHMKILCDSGIVECRKEGKWTHYSINAENMKNASEMLLNYLDVKKEVKEMDCNCNKDKIKLYFLTGFLGSGKTTLLKNIIEKNSNKKIGIIQNEFGKLGIDGSVIKDDSLKIVELNRGSIFCSCLKLSFVQALAELTSYDLDYVFVESSGLGDPSNTKEILSAVDVLAKDKYEFGGVICLIDALNFENDLSDLETVYRQLKHCHLAVVTKVDLIDEIKLDELNKKIRSINEKCLITTANNGVIALDVLNKNLINDNWVESEETTNTEETKPKTISMDFKGVVDEKSFNNFINDIIEDVYRVKGYFDFEGKGYCKVDVVGSRMDVVPCEKKELSQLVFISKIGPKIIRSISESWKKHIGLDMKLNN